MIKEVTTKCYHCGESCGQSINFDNFYFCCDGCKSVYQILKDNDLCSYYSYSDYPGELKNKSLSKNYKVLDDKDVIESFIRYKESFYSVTTFTIPNVHCISCIWLLENLSKIDNDIIKSRLDLNTKILTIHFKNDRINIRSISELLDKIGYPPLLNLDQIEGKVKTSYNKTLLIKLGIAGFCSANIMMFSFPEYLAKWGVIEHDLKLVFTYMSLILSLPVLFYCASDYFRNSFQGIKNRVFIFDLPIAISFIFTFTRSLYEIISGTGSGYLDSLTALIFLLLIGKYVQQRTFHSLSFERDYRSYFPLSVTLITEDEIEEKSIPVNKIKIGDKLNIRNMELIPADSILINDFVNIDYSFVTGESIPVTKSKGDMIFAGGRVLSSAVKMVVTKPTSQSYLTQLWNETSPKNYDYISLTQTADNIAKYFTFALIIVAVVAGIINYNYGITRMMNAVTSVLVIACPCALGIAIPFTFGNIVTFLGRKKIYLKNTNVVENIALTTDIVFDKTGTITSSRDITLSYLGEELSYDQKAKICKLVSNSLHPVSRGIKKYLNINSNYNADNFEEVPGIGISGIVDGDYIQIGSIDHTLSMFHEDGIAKNSVSFVSINNKQYGRFEVIQKYREGIFDVIKKLDFKYRLHLVSGDNDSELNFLSNIFNVKRIRFNQSPHDKLEYIKNLEIVGNKVMMIGDGLNDSGALMSANTGVSITEDESSFTPSSEVICHSDSLSLLPKVIDFCNKGRNIVLVSFGTALLYNIIGLSFAINGNLSPLIAAILMPISSTTIIIISLIGTKYYSRKLN